MAKKRQLDGEPDLDTVGNGSFVVIDSSLHNDFDDFKPAIHKERI